MPSTLPETTGKLAVRTRRITLDQPLRSPADEPVVQKALPIAQPQIPPADRVLPRIAALLSQPQLTNASEVRRFEEAAASYLGVPECVAVSSCTSGLMLVERCLELEGEVILPSFTFFATGHSLLWNGLTPVFADCDPDTFNLDPERVEALITPSTSAILAVHIFGCPANLDALEEIAQRHGIRLIVDGAHAFGARRRGRRVAQWSDATVFSLSPTKPLVTGEGGLIATRSRELAGQLRRARNYGKGSGYDCDVLGLNARMTEMQAILGEAGLEDVDRGMAHRNAVAEAYERALRDVPGILLQQIPPGSVSSRKDFAFLVEPEFRASREEVEHVLTTHFVESRRYFDPPMHRQKLYQQYFQPERDRLRVTDEISNNVVCLPIHQGVSVADARWIGEKIAAVGAARNNAA